MKQYNEYKDSGVKWIGKIPSHWEVNKIRSLFKLSNQKTNDPNCTLLSLSQYTGVRLKSECANVGMFEAETTIGYNIVQKGQFVMNIMLAWNGSYSVSNYNGVISPAYCVFDFIRNCDKKYFDYLLRLKAYSGAFKTLSKGLIDSRLRLYPEYFRTFPIVFPPVEEQNKIVAYLDNKVSKIDKYISTAEKKIAALDELKQVTIADAVTHGINPNAPMKDSEIPWIGMVPEHWEVKTLRAYIRIYSEKYHAEKQLLSVTREQGVILRDVDSKEENHNFIPDDLSGYKLVRRGDFAINKMKSWQGSYGVSNYEGIVSPAYYVCKLEFENKDFFSKSIRCKAYVPFFNQYSKGIRVDQWDLSPIALKNIPFFEPPISEQNEIVTYIDRKVAQIDKMKAAELAQIDKLKEYKQRLISDVVTGKVKVTNE